MSPENYKLNMKFNIHKSIPVSQVFLGDVYFKVLWRFIKRDKMKTTW